MSTQAYRERKTTSHRASTRVEELKRLVREGTYRPDASLLAEAMIKAAVRSASDAPPPGHAKNG